MQQLQAPRAAEIVITAVTLNAQGMQGKHKFYEAQLEEIGANVIMLQEVKQGSSCCLSRDYIRLTTDSCRGVSVWISRQRGIANLAGKPLKITTADLRAR